MSEKLWFLKRCDLFEGLTPAEKERLEGHALLRTFKRGEIIYFPSEPGQTVLVLSRGRVKIKTLGADGKETILTFIEEGELFGELALVDSEPRNEFAEAVEGAVVVAVPREDMLWLIGRRPDVALSVTKLLGLRRRRVENRLRNILFRSTRERVVALLLELLESYGRQAEGHWEIRLKLSHQELGNLIGATRESVTLTLGRLQVERFLQVRRQQIVILDRDRLSEEAAGAGRTPPDAPPGGKAHDCKALDRR
jgi:CRP-like cAMP-binding protein